MNDVDPKRIRGGNEMVILVHFRIITAVDMGTKSRERAKKILNGVTS